MPSARIPDAVRRVFTETFSARDIAEPLASFDAGVLAASAREFMEAKDFDVLGIRRDGHVVGYVERHSLVDGVCGQFRRSFDDAIVLHDSTSLLKLLLKLSQNSFAFITILGRVGGIITHADLQKPPVRMWLFGIVTLIEMRFAELIDLNCPEDTWKKYVSEMRLEKARTLLEERSRRNQRLQLVDCLQFSDKGQIVARNEDIRKKTIFASRSKAEAAVKNLERLRNNLAHAQDILTTDWDAIVQICEFFQSSIAEAPAE
jgi:hypothetical protein